MTNWIDKKCNETVWLTPEKLLAPVRGYFGGPIPLDAATEPHNPTEACKFFTEQDDGLTQDWTVPTFVNPPYGKVIKFWCQKICAEAEKGTEIIALLPCGSGRPGTIYWQDNILTQRLKAICYVRGRVSFIKSDGTVAKNNTYPSHLLGFNVNKYRFLQSFSSLGKVLEVCIQ